MPSSDPKARQINLMPTFPIADTELCLFCAKGPSYVATLARA